MIDSETTIVFVGHFDVGEKCRPLDRAIVAGGCQDEGALSVLVGDIGIREKIWSYLRHGIEGLLEGYRERWICSKGRACVHFQVPDFDEARLVVDVEQYEKAFAILNDECPTVVNYLGVVSREDIKCKSPVIYEHFARACRELVIPSLISDRLSIYGLDKRDQNSVAQSRVIKNINAVNIFSEQNLLNIAHRRIRRRYQHRSQSWRGLGGLFSEDTADGAIAFLGPEQMVSSNGTPLCRSIMLALYQEVGRLGKRLIVEHYDERVAFALISAQSLVATIARYLPEKTDWQLSFKTTIYREDPVKGIVSESLPSSWDALERIGSRYSL